MYYWGVRINKKLFFKLGLGMLLVMSSLSFVACGQKNISVGAINPSNLNSSNIENTAENLVEESEKSIASSVSIEQKAEQKPTNTEQEAEQKFKKYYNLIKEAKQKQIDYINSIEDPMEKHLVQTSFSAAVSQAVSLELKYPEDSEIIKESLDRVLNGTE